MDKTFSKRLAKLTPENGGVDLSFNLGSAGGQAGKVASTLALKVFGPSEKGMVIVRSVTIAAVAENIREANSQALDDALNLLGV